MHVRNLASATPGQQLLHLDNSWSTFVHTVPVDYGCLDNTWYICTCTTTVLVDPDSKSHASVNLMIIINCFSEFIDHVPRLCPKFLSDETICIRRGRVRARAAREGRAGGGGEARWAGFHAWEGSATQGDVAEASPPP